ncbi:MAG: hypothetical protein KFB93_03400 [Simkaniaceae bacterium]|jgi:hypothetical protein|nr:MAG: hypothetical protein KFB93_03400 [Simkaniaceae bacterium]
MSTSGTHILPNIIDDYVPSKGVDEVVNSFEPLIRSEIRDVTQVVTKQVYVGIWGAFGYATEVVEKQVIGEETVVLYPAFERDKKAIQQELAPFFDEPEKITYENVREYIEALNETYPDYAIDERGDLLSEIRRTKDAMIQRGEKGFVNGVGLYSWFSESGRETMLKVVQYKKDRDSVANDIDYQRNMLQWFKFFNS